jgi:hypothetical protein
MSAPVLNGAAHESEAKSLYVPLDPADFVSAMNARHAPAPLHSMLPLLQVPGMISLAGGLPAPELVRQEL